MARGTTHRIVTGMAVAPVAYGAYMLTGSVELGAAAGVGCLLTMAVNGDKDQQQHAGPLWKPYALVIKHRSPLSHLPVIGTLGRLLYLAFAVTWIVAMSAAITVAAYYVYLLWDMVQWIAYALVGGLMVGDLLHWLMDGMPV